MASKNKSSIYIYPKAKDRIMDIWSYSYDKWGEKQADSYIENMEVFINSIRHKKYLWRAVPHEDFAKIYFIRYEHHFIFFREFEDFTIGIISVLHKSMDIPDRLFEDSIVT